MLPVRRAWIDHLILKKNLSRDDASIAEDMHREGSDGEGTKRNKTEPFLAEGIETFQEAVHLGWFYTETNGLNRMGKQNA